MTLVYPQLPIRTAFVSEETLTGLQCSFKEIGRREWTRTIDPHHVKVVL